MQYILIIDDDQMICTIFKRYLEGQGYRVECAIDGRDGLRQLEGEPPDLVITDIMMPDVDGLEVVLTMREKHPGTPVIAISGGISFLPMDLLPMVEKFKECRVLYKPIELKDLLIVVKQLLEPDCV